MSYILCICLCWRKQCVENWAKVILLKRDKGKRQRDGSSVSNKKFINKTKKDFPFRETFLDSISNSSIPVVGVEPTLLTEHDFESCASANSATPAYYGGANRIRTGDKGFADLCLTTWLWRHLLE